MAAIQKHHESVAAQPVVPASASSRTPEKHNKHEQASRDERAALLRRVRNLLETGHAREALDLVTARSSGDPVLRNARGVCLMHLGQADAAVRAYRELNVQPGSILLRKDLPPFVRTNYAVALLLANNPSGCVFLLNEINREDLPRVKQLREAIRTWVAGLSLWQKLLWKLGVEPERPVAFSGIPIDLGDEPPMEGNGSAV